MNPQLVRADSQESVFSLTSCVSGVGSWQPGDRARIDQRSGTVAYVGPTKFAPGEWIGLILDEPLGKNDGSVQGYRYFSCKAQHGLFCKSSKLERIVLSPSRLKSPTLGDGETISSYAAEYGFDIGDRVVVAGGKHGTVRFIGKTEFAQGVWAGIELEQPLGKNDGSIQGKRYFTCKTPYGVFVPVSKVVKASSQTPGKMTVVQTKTSLLRQNRGLGGSRESLSSIGRSSIASSRYGLVRKPSYNYRSYSVCSNGCNVTIKALEEALKEKECHLEQVMRERDMERSEISQLPSGKQAEKIAKLESEKNTFENTLLEKEKRLEDLAFQLEEERVSKKCEIEELQKKLASLENASRLVDDSLRKDVETDVKCADWEAKCLELQKELKKLTDENSSIHTTLTADIDTLKSQLASVEDDNKNFNKLLEEERAKSIASNNLLETMRTELEKTKQQLSDERFAFEEQLSAANVAAEEKDKLLKIATCSSTEAEKELVKVKAELQLALKEAQDQREAMEMLTTSKGSKEDILVDKVHFLEEDLQSKMNDLHSMKMNNKALEDSVLSLERELTDLKFDLEVLHKEKKLLQETLEATELEKAATDELLTKKDEEIQWIKDYLMENITILTAEEEAKKTMDDTLKTKSESLLLENNELQERLNALKENLKAKNDENMRCDELEKQLREAETKITSEKAKLLSKEEELTDVNEKLIAIEVKHRNEVESIISEQTEHIEKLNSSLDSLKSANQDLSEKSNKLELKVTELENNLHVERQLFNEKEKELCDQLASAAAQWKANEENLVEELKKEREMKERLTSEKNELEKLSEMSKLELKERSEEIVSLRDKLEALTSELTQVTESRTQVEERLREQKDAFAALQNTVDSSKLGEDAMAKDLAAANTLCAERLTKINQLQSHVKSLEEKLCMTESLTSELTNKLSGTENRLTKLVEQRENDIEQLEQTLSQETAMRLKVENDLQTKSEEFTVLQHDIELLTKKSAELEELLGKLRSDLVERDVELEAARKERSDAIIAKDVAENQMSAVTLELQEERRVVDSSQALANQTKEAYEQLCTEHHQLKETLERLELENKELSAKLITSQSDGAAMQLLKEELATSNQLVMEYLKDKEKLLFDVDVLAKKLATVQESEQLMKQELDSSRLQIDQLSREHQLLLDQQQKSSVDGDGLKDKIEKELASAREEVRSVTDQRIFLEKEVGRLKEELNEKQREVTSLRLNEANANVLVAEAKQKIELYDELEEDWKKKQLRMTEKIDELTTQLEQVKARTQSEEITSLRKELAFSHSIIADQRRKEEALKEEIDILNKLSVESVTTVAPHISFGRREMKPRMYCDICEIFDKHETEDCPKQEEKVYARQKLKKPSVPQREYCDYCEEFGHDTVACGTHKKEKKSDYTF